MTNLCLDLGHAAHLISPHVGVWHGELAFAEIACGMAGTAAAYLWKNGTVKRNSAMPPKCSPAQWQPLGCLFISLFAFLTLQDALSMNERASLYCSSVDTESADSLNNKYGSDIFVLVINGALCV